MMGARKNECLMNDRKIQAIHSGVWLQCTHMVRGQCGDCTFADLGHATSVHHLIHIYIHY